MRIDSSGLWRGEAICLSLFCWPWRTVCSHCVAGFFFSQVREATSSTRMSVGFIGAGQLAHALVKGFTAAGEDSCLCTESSVTDVIIMVDWFLGLMKHLTYPRFSYVRSPGEPDWLLAAIFCPCLIFGLTWWLFCQELFFFLPPTFLWTFFLSGRLIWSHLCSYFPFPSPSPGVIAAQRITASSPDTDLPTVTGLRVRRKSLKSL